MRPDPRFHACIIAGGSGERLWPMSRVSAPKHLLKIFSERTLLEQTVLRLRGVVLTRNIWILTNRAQVAHVRRVLPGFPKGQIVAEPSRRDTAPAAALATGLVYARDPGGVVAILPPCAGRRRRPGAATAS
jgi:mannose-1-phosphate guanylyltransferase